MEISATGHFLTKKEKYNWQNPLFISVTTAKNRLKRGQMATLII
jgi:hypothetical protein